MKFGVDELRKIEPRPGTQRGSLGRTLPGSLGQLEDLWWAMTSGVGVYDFSSSKVVEVMTSVSNDLISSFFGSSYDLSARAPLLLVDLQGPSPGLSTNLVTRYVEEVG